MHANIEACCRSKFLVRLGSDGDFTWEVSQSQLATPEHVSLGLVGLTHRTLWFIRGFRLWFLLKLRFQHIYERYLRILNGKFSARASAIFCHTLQHQLPTLHSSSFWLLHRYQTAGSALLFEIFHHYPPMFATCQVFALYPRRWGGKRGFVLEVVPSPRFLHTSWNEIIGWVQLVFQLAGIQLV